MNIESKMVKAAYDSVKKLPRCLRTEDLPIHTFTPRTYQLELLDAALQQNTIICVNSPAGKTFIAVMLIKEMAVDIRPMPMDFNKRKFTIFIVSAEAQLELQAKVIAHHTDLVVAHYADEELLSTWEKEEWSCELLKCQVLVTTANFLQKLLECEYFSLVYVNLLLIDECSDICSSQAHMEVMKICEKCQQGKHPRVVVLTATLLSSKCKDPVELENTITMLETTFHSTAETSTLVFSERHGTSPKEALYECNNDFDEIQQMPDVAFILQEALLFIDKCVLSEKELENCKDPLQVPRTVLSECLNILDVLGPWCANHIAEMFIKQLDKLITHEQSEISKILLRYTATQLRFVTKIFEKLFNIGYCIDEFLQFVTPKVIKLVNILRSYKPEFEFVILRDEEADGILDSDDDTIDDMSDSDDCDSSGHQSKDLHITLKHPTARGENSDADPLEQDEEKKLCGLIFVDCKYVAYALNKVIEEVCAWDENLCFVKSSHITSYKNGLKRDSTNYRKHEEVLRKFRMQETNLLVATSNFEEGIDIPKCNLVVCFDPPKDYKSYSQSKARARARNANFIMLVDSEKARPFNIELKTYKRIEQVLLRKYNNQLDPTKEELNEILEKYPIPPFLPLNNNNDSTAPPITLFSAISIINRYCAKLPSDAFTYLTPKCSVEQTDFKNHLYYVATLKLPINSPVKKEVKGVPMPIEKLAKMSAALKMCQELQLQGELDDHFLPVGKEILKYEEKEALKDPLKYGEDGEWEEEEEEEEMVGCPRPGTTKRKQYYFKKAADALMSCHIEVGRQCQLYNIHMVLTGPITEEQNTRGRKIYVPENTPRGFGILSSKNIPQVPRFPVYTRSGEVTVSVNIVQPDLFITESQMNMLTAFHRFVFSTVLRLEKDPIDFMPEEAKVGYLIVPLIEDENHVNQINWNFVDEVQSSFSRKHPDIYDPKREKFKFCTGDFEDAVVMPSYRNMDQPQHFYVAEIKYDLNPNSPFPSPELYRTFNEYYSKKYGLHITNLDQPLLDVDHTSARLNLLTPRYMNQKGIALPTSSAETKKARRENLQQKQILIPELCVVHVFPASLWRKAVCLPAILYRINYLLIAEEIRVKIAQGTKIGVIDIPKGFQFPKLDFGFETNPEKIIDNRNENDSKFSKPINSNGSLSTETVPSISTSCEKDSKTSSLEEEKTLHEAENEEPTSQAEPEIGCENENAAKLHKDLKTTKETENDNMSGERNSLKTAINNKMPLPSWKSAKISANNNNSSKTARENRKITADNDASFWKPTKSDKGKESLQENNFINLKNQENWAQNSSSVDPPPKEQTSFAKSKFPKLQSSEKIPEARKEDFKITFDIPRDLGVPCESPNDFVASDSSSNIQFQNESLMKDLESLDIRLICSNTTYPKGSTFSAVDEQIRKERQEQTISNWINTQTVKEKKECSAPVELVRSKCKIVELPQDEDKEKCQNKNLNENCDKTKLDRSAPSVTVKNDSLSISVPPKTNSDQTYSHQVPSETRKDVEISSNKTDLYPAEMNGNVCLNKTNLESAGRAAAFVTEASTPDNLLQSSVTKNCDNKSEIVHSAVASKLRLAHTATANMPESSSSLSSSLSSSPTGSPSRHLPADATVTTNSSTQCPSPSQDNQLQEHSKSQHCQSLSSEEQVEAQDSGLIFSSLESIAHTEDHTIKKMASLACTSLPDCKASSNMKSDPLIPFTTENSKSCIQNTMVQSPPSTKKAAMSELGKNVPPSSATDNNANCDIPPTQKRDLNADVFQNVTSFCGESAQLDTTKISDYCIIADKTNANSIYSYASSQENKTASPLLPSSPPPPPQICCPPLLLDTDIELSSFIGPSPCVILQALTMSNANDFFSLERLETIGDSFLKYAITVYLYCQYPGIHEGKLSYLRSKQVSNYNLYRLGRKKGLPERMVSAKFEPYENWLPPGYVINEERRRGPVHKVHITSSNGKFEGRSLNSRLNGDILDGGDCFPKIEESKYSVYNSVETTVKSNDDSLSFIKDFDDNFPSHVRKANLEQWKFNQELEELKQSQEQDGVNGNGNSPNEKPLIPYSLQTIHSIPDKSVADCVEALIGCYLTCCGKRAALLFMSWLGLKVLPQKHILADRNKNDDVVTEHQLEELESPISPLLTHISNAKEVLEHLLDGYETFEKEIGYQFRDRSYLLQAFTHASYHYNTVTDCYQRLEFLGDAILDYVITRHLYEDSQRYSPGVLTDLRSALVNNNIFAALAVKWNFHKFFKAISPELFNVIERFVARQKEKEDEIDLDEEEEEEENSGEEVVEMEIPKALGDIFESVAGAIYLDSGMSLDVVWKVYYRIMKPQIDKYLKSIPKSPVRELLEMEPETAKFEKPERTVNGKIRVTVKVAGKGVYHGVGRNYRIAKSAAAKKALRVLKTMQAQGLIL